MSPGITIDAAVERFLAHKRAQPASTTAKKASCGS